MNSTDNLKVYKVCAEVPGSGNKALAIRDAIKICMENGVNVSIGIGGEIYNVIYNDLIAEVFRNKEKKVVLDSAPKVGPGGYGGKDPVHMTGGNQ